MSEPMPILPFRGAPSASQPARTVAWVVDWFLTNDVKLRSPVARTERARVLKLFCAFRNRDGRIMETSLTDEVIGADLVEFLNAHKLAQWTRRRWCSTVKRPFGEAAKLGIITHSPFQAVTEGRGGRGRDITWSEFRQLLRLATPAMRRVMLFLRWSGARPEELRTLEWPHIDFGAKQIVKREHKTAHTSKDGAPRVIPLNGHLMRLLLWLRRRTASRWVFVNSFGGQWKTRALCKNIFTLRQKASLPRDCKLYGCRHAFITEAIMNGLDLATVAEIAGHKNITTTQTYLHLADKREHLQAAMEKAFQWGGPKAASSGEQLGKDDLRQLLEALKRLVK